MDGIIRAAGVSHEVSNVWHVQVDGVWHAVQYDGYAPVCVEVDGHLKMADYRHMASGCTTVGCLGAAAPVAVESADA